MSEPEHQIFISYAHHSVWNTWVQEFAEGLQAHLHRHVGEVEVFLDRQIQASADWERVIRRKIATCKIMLPLISPGYFQREWCRRELAIMFEREEKLNRIGCNQDYGFIIPIRLGDGDRFPDLIRRIQFWDFAHFTSPVLAKDAPDYRLFHSELSALAKVIDVAIRRVPPCTEDWHKITGDDHFPRLCPKPPPDSPPRIDPSS